jgi:FKBP-type peptidyl-prolyl cis-trans isomerase
MPRSLAVAVVLAATLTATACGDGDTPADGAGTSAPTAAASATASQAPSAGSVTFQGVTVSNPKDLDSRPQATSSATQTPTELQYKDLVVGTGKAASPQSTVKVQYEGLLYRDGKPFDASWNAGDPVSFSLQQVVPGFTQGIGGTDDVPPMKVGGRRVMILPPSLGYPDGTPDGVIPAGSPIVFVVDLIALS